MDLILYFISTLLILLNLDAPPLTSDASGVLLLVEHFILLWGVNMLINKQLKGVAVRYRKRYLVHFLIGYCVSLTLMYLYWTPYMIKSWATNMDTFDPVKYYAIASEIVNGVPNGAIIAYPVSWIYVLLFYILGRDPLIPIFVNSISVLYAVLIISKYINNDNPRHVKYFSYLLLIPEVMYFNMMSAKDTICMICAVILFVFSQEFIDKRFKVSHIIIAVIALFAMVLARTSMSFVAILGVVLMFASSGKFSLKKIIMLIFLVAIITGALALTIGLGSHESTFNIQDKIGSEMAGDMSSANALSDQSKDSFMRYLVPSNPFEFIVFGIIRSFCYVIIDPGMITSPLTRFALDGSFKCPLMSNSTTVLMFLSLPFIFGLFLSWRKMNKKLKRLFVITMLYFLVVGMFNPLMLHIRYRVVYDLLYFTLALKSYLLFRSKRSRVFNISYQLLKCRMQLLIYQWRTDAQKRRRLCINKDWTVNSQF